VKARFIEPMLLLRTDKLPDSADLLYEIKLDGYRAIAFKSEGKVHLPSRNDNDFAARYAAIAEALQAMPEETFIDGEIVALGGDGRPSFNLLQNYGSFETPLIYYAFDVMVVTGENLMGESLEARRSLLEDRVLSKLDEPIRFSPELEARLPALIKSVKAQGFEGLVAKSRRSPYEPGQRTGAWQKMRVNQGQELVIGGYTPSLKNFEALVIGYYENDQLIYAVRTRNGFTPASRAELFRKLKPLETETCPFANLPEKKAGRRGAGLTAEKMRECHWLAPVLVGQFEFVQWTEDGEAASHYTRSSNRATKVSDHASISPAHGS
jgi:bifunctional non-homologous end joining protein LigD